MFAIQQSCALLLGMHAWGGCSVLRCCLAPLHTHLLSSAPCRVTVGVRRMQGCVRWAAIPAWPGAPCRWRSSRAGGRSGCAALWATPYSGAGWLVEHLPQLAGCSISPAKLSVLNSLAGCCRVTHVLWPPSRWGALAPQPSLTRVVGKGGTLEFLQPPSREQDWWS